MEKYEPLNQNLAKVALISAIVAADVVWASNNLPAVKNILN